MKKRLYMILVVLILGACTKNRTTLEIYEDKSSTKSPATNEKTEMIKGNESKPLIYISKADPLQVYVRADGAPGMFLNKEGDLEGFYVELEVAVMKEMDQNYNLVPYSDLGPLIQKIKTGEAHSALATPILPDYESFLNLSIKYEDLNYVIFLQEDSKEIIPMDPEKAIKSLFGKKIGVQTRGHIYQVLRDYKEIEIIEYPTTTVAMEALNNGDVDAVPEVERVGLRNANLNKWKVKPVGPTIFTLGIGTAFSQALDKSVVERYNSALQRLIDSGYVKNLYSRYFNKI